jgi:hypothetical protein
MHSHVCTTTRAPPLPQGFDELRPLLHKAWAEMWKQLIAELRASADGHGPSTDQRSLASDLPASALSDVVSLCGRIRLFGSLTVTVNSAGLTLPSMPLAGNVVRLGKTGACVGPGSLDGFGNNSGVGRACRGKRRPDHYWKTQGAVCGVCRVVSR